MSAEREILATGSKKLKSVGFEDFLQNQMTANQQRKKAKINDLLEKAGLTLRKENETGEKDYEYYVLDKNDKKIAHLTKLDNDSVTTSFEFCDQSETNQGINALQLDNQKKEYNLETYIGLYRTLKWAAGGIEKEIKDEFFKKSKNYMEYLEQKNLKIRAISDVSGGSHYAVIDENNNIIGVIQPKEINVRKDGTGGTRNGDVVFKHSRADGEVSSKKPHGLDNFRFRSNFRRYIYRFAKSFLSLFMNVRSASLFVNTNGLELNTLVRMAKANNIGSFNTRHSNISTYRGKTKQVLSKDDSDRTKIPRRLYLNDAAAMNPGFWLKMGVDFITLCIQKGIDTALYRGKVGKYFAVPLKALFGFLAIPFRLASVITAIPIGIFQALFILPWAKPALPVPKPYQIQIAHNVLKAHRDETGIQENSYNKLLEEIHRNIRREKIKTYDEYVENHPIRQTKDLSAGQQSGDLNQGGGVLQGEKVEGEGDDVVLQGPSPGSK